MSDEATRPNEFLVSSIYGHNTQQPLVNLTYGAKDFHVQMLPEDAIDLAHNLLAAAEASLTDAYLVGFFRGRVGADQQTIAIMLMEFREWREMRQEAAERFKDQD